MIPYMVGKLAPNLPYWTRGLVRYVPGRGYFRAVPSQNRDKFVTSPPTPIVERVFGRVELHAPPVMTREKQVARKMQERQIPPAAAQDKTEAASSRFAPAISHADATNFAQLSPDAQPRPTPKTLVTRSFQPVSNAMYYAQFPENDDRNSRLNFSHDVLTSVDLSEEFSRIQNEVALCRQRKASYPSEIQGKRAAMDRHERFRSELAAGFEAEKKRPTWTGDVLLSVWTEKATSASRSTTTATGSCIGRSRISKRAFSAATQERQPPRHESPYCGNWRQQGTLQA